MTDQSCERATAATDAEHLADLADGCGCAEVWEHLSEQRESDAD